jgi:hypothetical protein
MKKLLFILVLLLLTSRAYAHPGRTDASGCHTCRTNCANWGLSTGEYHCHNAKALPQPEEPIHSKYGEGGTGYTYPAPEYKQENINNNVENIPVVNTVNNSDETNNDNSAGVAVATVGIGGVGYYLFRVFKK